MNLGQRFNSVACLTVFLGLLTFCLADSRPGLAIISAVVCLIGWLAGRSGHGWKPITLPRTLINLLVLGAIFNAAVKASGAHGGQPIVSHLGEFLVYVQLLKLFDRRTARDESQLLTLSIFVIIAAMLTSNTLPVGLCLLAYTPTAVGAAMLYQLRSGARRASGESRDAVSAPPPDYAAGRRASPHLRRLTSASLLAATILAAVIFVLTPRGLVAAGALGRFGEARVTQTGFSEQIRLGQSGFLQDSNVPVLDLTIEDASGNNLGSRDRIHYLRGITRDRYEQTIWTNPHRAPGKAQPTTPGVPLALEQDAPAPSTRIAPIIQRITQRAPARDDPVLFAIWRPLSITTAQPISLEIGTADLSIRRKGPGDADLTYIVQSSPTDGFDAQVPAIPTDFAEGPIRDLAVSVLQRARVPVEPWQRGRPENRQAAAAIRDHLLDTCSYSRELIKPPDGIDPIEMFLFDTRRGHCEYFASAMVAMCQSVGLPARLVAGYVAADFNSLSGKYVVRQSNAHAWVEYHLGDGLWQTIDPSPAEDVAALQARQSRWFAAIRNWYDALEFNWNRSIVDFNAARQQSSGVGRRLNFERLSQYFDDLSGRLFVRASETRRSGGLGAILTWIFAGVAAVALIVVALRLRSVRRGASRTSRRRSRRAPAVQGSVFYDQALRLLGRAGIAKPDSLPPLAHASDLAGAGHPASSPLKSIAGLYYRVRFAGQRLTPTQAEEVDAALADLRTATIAPRRRPPPTSD